METILRSSFVIRLSSSRALGAVVLSALLFGVALAPNARAQYPTADDFNPGVDYSWGMPDVSALAIQADGRILVVGSFSTLAGQPRNGCGRLNTDGTLDLGFNPGPDMRPWALAVQADGRILVGGRFSTLCGQPRTNLARLNPDGTLDAGFHPGPGGDVSGGACVNALLVQADDRILVGGNFNTMCGQPRLNLARLNPDGTLDAGFNPEPDDMVVSVAVQTDGRILVGGYFEHLGGQAHAGIGRLNSDGSPDPGFNPAAYQSGGTANVLALAVQTDGKILVGGGFTDLCGQARNGLGRLNADGTLDTGFDLTVAFAGTTPPHVRSVVLQADGKILVGGLFRSVAGQWRTNIVRLNADGTVDSEFGSGQSGISAIVRALAVQADGKILVGGKFSTLGGQPRRALGRLNATEPATQSLTSHGSTITWLRGGTSPEVWRTTFEHSPDGLNWTPLGSGTRIPSGWQLTGLSLPPGGAIRARGYVSGGSLNGSAWFVETGIGAPAFVTQPFSSINNAGTTASFTVVATSSEPLNYQWSKDGVALEDAGNIAGARTPNLTLSHVLKSDEGGYRVVVSNALGSVTSAVATLKVVDPVINGQPVSQRMDLGDNVTFTVTAVGTPPLTYQWWRDGIVVTQGTNASLTLSNLAGTDAGFYAVVVSNRYGSVTSAPAFLTVNLATLDSDFNPGAAGEVGGEVRSVVVQADGKILVGGFFTTLGGQPCNYLGRLNADGTRDAGFDPRLDGVVLPLALQADGKMLVGGSFATLGGQPRNFIGRLNADGTLDTGFNPGANDVVNSLTVQSDGKILVAGYFTTLAGHPRSSLGRLNADGTLDAAFNPGADFFVFTLALQPDGRILVGGQFTKLGGQPRNYLGRLNADGTLDTGFNPGANGGVYLLALQADGKILVAGGFTTLAGHPRNYFGRLNPDGTLDRGFNPEATSENFVSGSVFSLAVQADGKILVGGGFATLNGQSRNRIGRLNADGSLDACFDPGSDPYDPTTASSCVNALAVEAHGKILVGGHFTTLGGQPRTNIGRLNNTEPATQSLTCDGSTITWLRGGTSPEVWRTTFEHSAAGTNWTGLGAGTRIPGGWQLTGLSLPPGVTIRARGYVTGGQFNGSSWWFVERNLTGPWGIRLSLVRDGSDVVLSWTGGQGPYQVQQATALSPASSWENVGAPVPTNSMRMPIGPGNVFLRVRGQ